MKTWNNYKNLNRKNFPGKFTKMKNRKRKKIWKNLKTDKKEQNKNKKIQKKYWKMRRKTEKGKLEKHKKNPPKKYWNFHNRQEHFHKFARMKKKNWNIAKKRTFWRIQPSWKLKIWKTQRKITEKTEKLFYLNYGKNYK